MLNVHKLSKSYGIQTLLDQVNFNLNPGERLGLIGPNGCGKSTLLQILAGVEKADSGWVALDPPNLQIGYLPQGLTLNSTDTIEGFLDDRIGKPAQLSNRLEILATRLTAHPDQVQLQQEYDKTLAEIQATAYIEKERGAVLASLGLDQVELTAPVAQLSGGQKTRLALASVLLFSPHLFLLDEPTNHLDIEMLEWLENWLIDSTRKAARAALIVSHDRVFLDRTVSGILELDPTTHQLKAYSGNYSAYLEQKLTELENHWKSYSDQQEEIARLKQAARTIRSKAVFKQGGKGDSGDKFARGFFANRTKEHVARAKHIEHRLETILTEEKIDKPCQGWQMKLDFDRTMESSRQVLVTESLDIGYGEISLLKDLNLSLRFGQRLALIGPNGSGKTTLLRTIAGILPPMAGRVRLGGSIRPGYMSQEQEALDSELNALDTIRLQSPFSETIARTFLHQFLFSGDDVFTPVGNLSFGERSRLILASLVASGCNLLLLDEPINHLDIPSRARFEHALSVFNGTLIVVSHDRYFIDQIADTLWEIRPNGLQVLPRS